MSLARTHGAFTLIELAIVLVIIGLLVGGVLVGQDLIRSATINAVVNQLDRLDAATNTFRDKYGGLPGDLLASRANQFGLTPVGTGSTGQGDGNGILQNGAAGGFGNETNVYWLHLGGSGASLIPDQGGSSAIGYGVPGVPATPPAGILPVTRLRDTSYVHVYSVNGKNYYYIGAIAFIGITGTLVNSTSYGVTPIEAYAIDNKRDDSNGITGTIQAGNNTNNNATFAAGTGLSTDCFTTTQGIYASNATSGGNLNCDLFIRTSW